jgi:hypothetical protein
VIKKITEIAKIRSKREFLIPGIVRTVDNSLTDSKFTEMYTESGSESGVCSVGLPHRAVKAKASVSASYVGGYAVSRLLWLIGCRVL